MFGIKKRRVLVWSVTISLLTLTSCKSSEERNSVTLNGETQGTTYTIIIVEDEVTTGSQEINALLADFDNSLSTYIPESVISKINGAQDSIQIEDSNQYFATCYSKALEVYTKTDGAFDPSVFPLVEGWGFMKHIETPLDSASVDSLMQFVSFEPGKYHTAVLTRILGIKKSKPGFKIDFNAIAQGYSVDVVDAYLNDKGYENYYIEIGGELIVRGENREGEKWRIGIDSPIENPKNRELENIIHVSGKAVATSGNYRNFYEKEGVKYAHTLNPKTGWPVDHQLLSVTVITEECALADAYATAFMVMGVDATLEFISSNKEELDVYMIYMDENDSLARKYTEGFDKYFE